MNLFSSREVASIIWLIILCVFVFLIPKIRSSALKLLKISVNKQIITLVVIIIFYSSFWIIVASQYSFWNWKYLKEVIFWIVFSGIPMCFGAIIIKNDDHYFANILKSNLKFIVILEFLLSTFTFHIIIELILVPSITFLVLLDTVAGLKEEYSIIKKITSIAITFIGLTVLVLTMKNAFANYTDMGSIDLLITFSIPIVLALLFIPISYSYALYSKYQELFIIMKFKEPKNKKIRMLHRWETVKVCKLSYRRVTVFRRTVVKRMYKNMSKEEFYEIIESFK
ncbi:hypothetical protein SAMN04488100_12311 [Alkalibacterium putridalgicola]|uniref:Uncharacterized protein n=1 Tax=Alkalibacterium putridalgicola TaxID=426703 RepID=A0A1H7VA27_9LACT|nr:hypothetical protein [Alkalibacterium putridalgicola]GEK88632.1 hypothetical protein APU01nite_06710 [Alkalibacterium putridalgicola]SEM06036.1 hypothetical protein SAMN04488100_12311 [Alkalibacterium putridalgicola]